MKVLMRNTLRETAGSTVFCASRVMRNRKCASRATVCGKGCGKRGKHGFPSLASRSHVGLRAAGSGKPPFRGVPVSRAGHVEISIGMLA